MDQTTIQRDMHKVEDEIDLKEVFQTISRYKWSILFTTLLIFILAIVFLYFKTPIYSSAAVIEVKSNPKQGFQPDDFLGNAFSSIGTEKVDKEIEILKTFHVNNLALQKLNFKTRYFIEKNFKKVELYEDTPIIVNNIKILDRDLGNKLIKLSPIDDGFTLQIKSSFKEKIFNQLFKKKLIELNDPKLYHFGEKIKTDYFILTIEKKEPLTQPVYFTIKDNNRQIYQAISRNLQITQINKNAPLIKVAYQDAIPQRANEYVNALIESFISQSVAEKSKKNDRIINFIKNQLHDMKIKLDNSEKKLEEYRIKNQAIDPSLQAQTYIKELSNIEIELSKNRLKEKLLDNLLPYAKSGSDLDAIAPSLMELNDQPTLELITRLQDAQIKEEGLKAEYSGKHPGLIAVRKQIQQIKEKITLSIKNLKANMTHRNQNLEKLKKSYEAHLKSLPTQERTLINLKRDYEVSSETYRYLLKKKSENEMIKVAILSDYRIIDSAYNDGRPVSPKRLPILIVSLIIGLIIGASQAFFRNFINDKIQTKEDIENLTTLPIYGVLPALKYKQIDLEVFKNPKSPFTESYRSLRTNLQFAKKEGQSNVVLVTSSIAGEGKSTTVANLGAIFQIAGYKSIVLNLDLRKPTLHHYFNVENHAGMSTYLSGKNSIEEIIQSTTYENLDIIASGPIPPNPSELILTERLDQLLHDLKEVYDYIFIDSAPLGLVTDTMHLMQYTDINLIVFRENYAKKSFVTDLNHLVKQHNLTHIGIVINSVESSSSSYGYGYGYGYGK